MTRYMERSELLSLLRARTDDESTALAASIAAEPSIELVVINRIEPDQLVHTYEVRLKRSLDGEGPRVAGLAGFVQTLHDGDVSEMFRLDAGTFAGIGFLDPSGHVSAITLVHHAEDQHH